MIRKRQPFSSSFLFSTSTTAGLFCKTQILLQRGGGGRNPHDPSATPNAYQRSENLQGVGGRTGKAFNPFSPEISNLRRLLVLVNPQSGWREAAGAFAAHVTETLDTTGVIHKSRTVPPEELKAILRDECKMYPQWDGVLLCGGDGLVNSYSYLMTLPEFGPYWLKKPVAILPAGANNGIAHSLGFGNPGAATSAFISGRTREIPLWKATVHNPGDAPNSAGTTLSAAIGGINIGLFADVLMSSEKFKQFMLGFVVIPVPRRRNYLASLYHIALMSEKTTALKPISIRYTTVAKEGVTTGGEIAALNPEKGLQLLIASQMKWHHKGYSLTPKAEFGKQFIGPWYDDVKPYLTVTTAKGDVSRSRMMHLLQREGAEAELELEDGIETFNCHTLELCIGGKKKHKFLLDGEECELMPGQTLKLAPAGVNLKFMVP